MGVGPKFAALQLAPVRVVDCCRGLAACPPSWVDLIFCRHAVACLSSIGPTLFSAYFSAFPDGDSKVCVCVCVCVCDSKVCVCVCVCVCSFPFSFALLLFLIFHCYVSNFCSF